MYYDDPYDPNLENDYNNEPEPAKYYDDNMSSKSSHNHPNRLHQDDDDSTLASSVSSTRLARRQAIERAKQADPGYFSVKRNPEVFSKKMVGKPKPVKVGYYHTNCTPGNTIRNAVSGLYETGRLTGSKEQDLFFKMALCTGENGNDTHFLFYDSPAQCERHFYCKLSDEVKDKWNVKSAEMRLICTKAEEAANTKRNGMIEIK